MSKIDRIIQVAVFVASLVVTTYAIGRVTQWVSSVDNAMTRVTAIEQFLTKQIQAAAQQDDAKDAKKAK